MFCFVLTMSFCLPVSSAQRFRCLFFTTGFISRERSQLLAYFSSIPNHNFIYSAYPYVYLNNFHSLFQIFSIYSLLNFSGYALLLNFLLYTFVFNSIQPSHMTHPLAFSFLRLLFLFPLSY